MGSDEAISPFRGRTCLIVLLLLRGSQGGILLAQDPTIPQ